MDRVTYIRIIEVQIGFVIAMPFQFSSILCELLVGVKFLFFFYKQRGLEEFKFVKFTIN